MPLFRRILEEGCGRTVRHGHAEAASLGNALVQGISLGRWRDIPDISSEAKP